MALIGEQTVTWAGNSRKVTVYDDSITEAAVDYIVISALPGDYSPTEGSAIKALKDRLNIDVRSLSANPLKDFRPTFPVWVSQSVAAKAPFKYIVVFEPEEPAKNALDMMTLAFSAIRSIEGSRAITAATTLVCTGSGGVDKRICYDEMFYVAAHWAGMQQSFPEVRICIPDTTLARSRIDWLKYQYTTPSDVGVAGYTTYYKQAVERLKTVSIPSYLTYRQALGICIYTSNFYTTMNSALRGGDHASITYNEMLGLFESVDTGLRNIADYTKITYRGESNLSEDRIKENQPGNTVTNLAYTSTAWRPGSWYNTAKFRFTFQSRYGALIQPYSIYTDEDEVLFGRFMQYYVNDLKITDYYLFTCDETAQALRR